MPFVHHRHLLLSQLRLPVPSFRAISGLAPLRKRHRCQPCSFDLRSSTRALAIASFRGKTRTFVGQMEKHGVTGIAEIVGEAASAEELSACKIGGCCGKSTPRLSHDAVLFRLKALPQWNISADRKVISRSLVAKDWKSAMQFFNDVSVLAEEEGHHPDLHLTGWRNVRLDMSTHAIDGLSLPDFVLAAKIDKLEVVCSPKWLKQQQAAAEQGVQPDDAMKERFALVERYVSLGTAHDQEGLLGMLATPCEMFGEPASREGMAWYFDHYPEVKFDVTTPPCLLSAGDPYTVRVAYTRSWRQEDKRQKVEVNEFFTFAEGGQITHIGYVEPPSEPVLAD